MPGLIRAMGRTAVVAGTATAVSNRVSRRQARRWSGDDAPAYMASTGPQQQEYAPEPQYEQAPPAPAAPAVDPIEQLTKLAELKQAGVLTDEEFAVQKNKILNP